MQALKLAGISTLPIAVDEQGLDTEALARILRKRKIDAIMVTPHHQFPTTVTMSAERRLHLMQLASKHNFYVIEDDCDHEFHWEGKPVLPLASHDPEQRVIYIGTLSKILAPGLRVGYLSAAPNILDECLSVQRIMHHHGDHSMEYGLSELFEEGEIQRHVARSVRIYRKRRDSLASALEQVFASELQFTLPTGGLGIWVHNKSACDIAAWQARARELGAAFYDARFYAMTPDIPPCLRLGFARLPVEQSLDMCRQLKNAS